MNNRPRISEFWLRGGHLTYTPPTPPPDDPPLRYQYGVEHGEGGPVVHRFAFGGDRDLWAAEDETGRRERVTSHHRLVKAANKRGQWNEDDQ